MARFEPLRGVRYDQSRVELADVIAPPYDVINQENQRWLESRSPYNAVRVELSRDDGERSRYEVARANLADWLAAGILIRDPEPGFYVYRIGYKDEAARPRQTTGFLGLLGLDHDVLPHERTLDKPKDDRLNLLRTTRANISPIWGLSLARGLSALGEVSGPPLARCTDDAGNHHRLWRVTEAGALDAVAGVVGSAPVIIADGHHRYATAIAYRDERRAAARNGGSGAGSTLPGKAPEDFVLAFVVELAEDELTVGAIHRVVSGLPAGFDPAAALGSHFTVEPQVSIGPLPALVESARAWSLKSKAPTPHAVPGDVPDATLIEGALADWPTHDLGYRNSVEEIVADVEKGEAQVGLVLRPPTVAQIAETARAGRTMPQKTTFFRPKPSTGLVLRLLDE